MPLVLSPERKEEVFLFIRKAFSDFRYFDELVSGPLKAFIEDSTKFDIDFQITKSIAEKYLNVHSFQTKEQKDILEKIRIILTATAVYLCSLSNPSHISRLDSIEALVEEYPQFLNELDPTNPLDEQELRYLLKFRNYMVIAIKLVQAKGNKLFLLRVVERLEGSNNEYITGTGQKPTVSRRVEIFHRESEVTIVKKLGKRKNRENMDSVEKESKKPHKDTTISSEPVVPVPAKTAQMCANTVPTTSVVPTETEKQQHEKPMLIDFGKLFSDVDGADLNSEQMTLLLGETYGSSLTEELFGKKIVRSN